MFNIDRQSETSIISESVFYTLVSKSRNLIVKSFRIWVILEILPYIKQAREYQVDVYRMEQISSQLANMKVAYVQINNMENMLAEQRDLLTEMKEQLGTL